MVTEKKPLFFPLKEDRRCLKHNTHTCMFSLFSPFLLLQSFKIPNFLEHTPGNPLQASEQTDLRDENTVLRKYICSLAGAFWSYSHICIVWFLKSWFHGYNVRSFRSHGPTQETRLSRHRSKSNDCRKCCLLYDRLHSRYILSNFI